MIQSKYTAKSGLITLQQRLDTIGNNVANINTVGFKGTRSDFKTLMFSELERPLQPQEGANLNRGVGVMLGANTKSFLSGIATMTGNPLDCSIEGYGFFKIRKEGEEDTLYTRAGKFDLSVEGNDTYLVTPQGYYLLDENDEPISLRGISPERLKIHSDGTLYTMETFTNAQGMPETRTVTLGKIGLVHFMNRQGLEAVGTNLFAATEASGEAQVDNVSELLQGYQEGSNIDLAQEMTRLIRTQRAFSLVSRALTTADEMDQQANTIRR